MTVEKFGNSASSVLVGPITAGTTAITVADGSRFPVATAGAGRFRAAFVDTTASPPAVLEYLLVTARVGNTLTVVRAAEDASRYPAASRADGTAVYHLVTAGALGSLVPFATLAGSPDLLTFGTLTRNSDGAVTSAQVTWPDGTAGVFTATVLSTAFPGAVDAYTITYGSPATVTYTQPTVTRDASGAVTVRPAITAV